MGFRLENGKTVSICEAAGSSELAYTYGVLGEEPELVYRGPQRHPSFLVAQPFLELQCSDG